MARRNEKAEFYSGIPWVYITPEQARALPQGKLNLTLILIGVYFVVIGFVKFGLVLSFGAGFSSALLNGVWPILTGAGLLFRVPWSIILALVSATLTVWGLVRGSQLSTVDNASLISLLETIINVGILFYLVEGERPNLIYRHRFRKYSVEDSPDDVGGHENEKDVV